MDTGSNLEATQSGFTGVIQNPLNIKLSRSVSNFDVRHLLNANWLIGLPFGRDKRFFHEAPKAVNAIIGGWQLTGIFRYSSGLPGPNPFNSGLWPTNWQISSGAVRIRPVETDNVSSVLATNGNRYPNVFSDPLAAFRSYRNGRAGEAGDRNVLRFPSYVSLDAGLSKTFNLPYAEKHKLQFRWEVFNVTNTQRFGPSAGVTNVSAIGIAQDPEINSPPADFGRYVGSQTPTGESRPGRVMQFALRYSF